MGGVRELVCYRNLKEEKLFYRFAALLEDAQEAGGGSKKAAETYYACVHAFAELAQRCGFSGNLWHMFLAYLLAHSENAYTKACEIRGRAKGSIRELARHDLVIFRQLFAFDLSKLESAYGVGLAGWLLNFDSACRGAGIFGHPVRDALCALAKDLAKADGIDAFQERLEAFYREFGVGEIGLHAAFGIARAKKGVRFVPITNMARVSFDDLIGYEAAKQKLIDNTEAFVSGRRANNCLLYGDAGTGKSTSIKAVADRYYGRGLRLVEIYKHQFSDLRTVIAQLKERNYKFILYMDDLSFEDFEVEYKYLKAVIEGGLEKKPDNILIYATSNRRHLIREKFSDKKELLDDLHGGETVQEKLSLAARFGVQIYFGAPDRQEFCRIVSALARKNQIPMEEDALLALANQWELRCGGRSGRVAQQLMDDLLGKGGSA